MKVLSLILGIIAIAIFFIAQINYRFEKKHYLTLKESVESEIADDFAEMEYEKYTRYKLDSEKNFRNHLILVSIILGGLCIFMYKSSPSVIEAAVNKELREKKK
jgi:hypothetical protein